MSILRCTLGTSFPGIKTTSNLLSHESKEQTSAIYGLKLADPRVLKEPRFIVKTMSIEQKQQGIAHVFHTSGNPLEATIAHWVIIVVEAH